MSQIEYRGCRVVVISHRTEAGWRPGVTIEAGGRTVKHLAAPEGVFFETEKASDETGLRIAVTWINERGDRETRGGT